MANAELMHIATNLYMKYQIDRALPNDIFIKILYFGLVVAVIFFISTLLLFRQKQIFFLVPRAKEYRLIKSVYQFVCNTHKILSNLVVFYLFK